MMHLSATDYGSVLEDATEGESATLSVAMIDEKLRQKLLLEFKYIRNNCVAPLSTFLDYMTSVYHHLFFNY